MEFKNKIIEVKISLGWFNGKLEQAEQSKLEYMSFEIIKSEEQKEKKTEESLSDF